MIMTAIILRNIIKNKSKRQLIINWKKNENPFYFSFIHTLTYNKILERPAFSFVFQWHGREHRTGQSILIKALHWHIYVYLVLVSIDSK